MTDAISKEVRRLVVTVLFVVGFSCFVLGLIVREIIEPSVAVLLLIVIGIAGATFFEHIIYGDARHQRKKWKVRMRLRRCGKNTEMQ